MGSAYVIVLEGDCHLCTQMDGKGLARNAESLDDAARSLGVRPLSEFVSVPPEDLADLMDAHDIDPDELDAALPPLEQFTADEGLAVVRALAGHPTGQDPAVAGDLRACEQILIAAKHQDVGWHFEVDY